MSNKKSDAELLARLDVCPRPGARYAHYKTGNVYIVWGAAIAEGTQEPWSSITRSRSSAPES